MLLKNAIKNSSQVNAIKTININQQKDCDNFLEKELQKTNTIHQLEPGQFQF